jgi:hypothetical protein
MPYRVSENVAVDVDLPDDPAALIPGSAAPIVVSTREDLAAELQGRVEVTHRGRHRAY